MDVGFQLSYLAVAGIVVIYPWLIHFWVPPGKWLFMLYQGAMVSVAATIATLPLTLYYFGTFPLWFLPANMLIVPLSSVLIVVALIMLLTSWVPLLSTLFAKLTLWLCMALSGLSGFFANLPYATIENLKPDGWQLTALFLCILGSCLYFIYTVRGGFWFAAVCMTLFAFKTAYNRYQVARSGELI